MITPYDFDRFAETVQGFFFLIVNEVAELRIDLRQNTDALRENTAARNATADAKDPNASPR